MPRRAVLFRRPLQHPVVAVGCGGQLGPAAAASIATPLDRTRPGRERRRGALSAAEALVCVSGTEPFQAAAHTRRPNGGVPAAGLAQDWLPRSNTLSRTPRRTDGRFGRRDASIHRDGGGLFADEALRSAENTRRQQIATLCDGQPRAASWRQPASLAAAAGPRRRCWTRRTWALCDRKRRRPKAEHHRGVCQADESICLRIRQSVDSDPAGP